MYDLAILGGGPAGVAAGVYAARKRLRTAFISKEFGGQSVVSTDIQNWIGTVSISGNELAKSLERHLRAYAGDIVDIKSGEYVKNLSGSEGNFRVLTDKETYKSRAILITTGSHRRKLEVPGADKFENKGVTYCASCDGPLFADMDTAVVGGGNSGFETAAQLLSYAKSVTLVHRRDEFRADPITIKKVLSHPKMKTVTSVEILEVKGDKFVEGLVYKENKTGATKEIPVQGIFVEIGSIPTSGFAENVVKLDEYKNIIVDSRTGQTETEGIWAAGDVTNMLYHQNNIAAGDAVRALEDIYMHLHAK
ncbi:MAG: FAD-dependent oxidoreductase [bacterium]|nr:FAD-dependent oxidoreductase [bacterium]